MGLSLKLDKYKDSFSASSSGTFIRRNMVIRIGRGKEAIIKLKNHKIDEIGSYKYLGEIINNKINLDNQIEEFELEVYASTQKTPFDTRNKEFKV